MKTAGWIVLAALGGWLVRGIPFESAAPPAPPARTTQPAVVKTEPVAELPSVMSRNADRISSLGKRNLFAYREHATVAAGIPHMAPPAIVPPLPVLAETPPDEPPPPTPFPYRYIGTFGPPHHRVAAFKRDNEIHTLFAGDRLGAFTLRSIGIESVEVEGPDGVRRIPLTD